MMTSSMRMMRSIIEQSSMANTTMIREMRLIMVMIKKRRAIKFINCLLMRTKTLPISRALLVARPRKNYSSCSRRRLACFKPRIVDSKPS